MHVFLLSDFARDHRLPRNFTGLFAVLAWALMGSLSACGGGGGSGGGGGGSGGGGGGTPTASISVSPASVSVGQTATLSWSSSNADLCEGRNAWSGSLNLSGTQTLEPVGPGTFTYVLVCSNFQNTAPNNQITVSATLTVSGGSAYRSTDLVSRVAGGGGTTVDAHLVNPWGIAVGASTAFRVANNGDQSSTAYDGTGTPHPISGVPAVHLPAGASGQGFSPTGVAFNGTSDFTVSSGGVSAPAQWVFVGQEGVIAGWSSSVDAENAIAVYSDNGGAVYTGVAIASNSNGNFIYATDFHNGKVDMLDARFNKQSPGVVPNFRDVALPANYAPFGILALKNGPGGTFQIYVSFAQREAAGSQDATAGAGTGVIDVFDSSGSWIKRLVSDQGVLNAPWGMALAPGDFGDFSGALLVGNVGDGRINAFDASTGAFLGTLQDASGTAIAIAGLRGLGFGNDALSQPHNTLFFSAGTNGQYGRIDLATAP